MKATILVLLAEDFHDCRTLDQGEAGGNRNEGRDSLMSAMTAN